MDTPINSATRLRRHRSTPYYLKVFTGCAWLIAAAGVFVELYYHEFYCTYCQGDGTIGLLPLYLGFPLGGIGFVLVLRRAAGWSPALLAAAGLVGIVYFMASYPAGAAGWLGGILVGMAHLFLSLPGRFIAVLWIGVAILGHPQFGQPAWGLINAFNVFGVATALSGAFILWGLPSWPQTRSGGKEATAQ